MAKRKLSREELVAIAWKTGDFRYKCRPNGQLDAYNWIETWKRNHPASAGPLLINAHRRFGKSYLSILLGIKRALRRPRQRIRIIAPTKLQGIGIFAEQYAEITHDRPSHIDLKPTGDDIRVFNYDWPNASADVDFSTITINGTESGSMERLRGWGSDMIIIDEPRDIKDLEYLIKHVIGWHLFKRKQPLMVVISTPPRSSDHYLFSTMIPDARAKHRYFEMPLSKDKDVTPEDEAFILELVGSKESIAWQREAECQLLPDPGNLILYEWSRAENAHRVEQRDFPQIVDEYKLPEYWIPCTTIDAGYHDANGVVFWFWDFEARKMVVLDEFFARQLNSKDLSEAVVAREKLIFSKCRLYPRDLRRTGDLKLQQRADMRDFFGFGISQCDLHDRLSAIDAMNATIAAGDLIIQSRCEELLFQVRNGSYQKEGSDKFMRTPRMGHCDLVSSLVSAHRDVPRLRKMNPFPEEGAWYGDQFIPFETEEQHGGLAVLSEMTYTF